MKPGGFISRDVKAEWGFACNQRINGTLWAGKGYRCTLKGQLGDATADEIADALKRGRLGRNGRFWVDLESRIVTMMIGDGLENRYKKVKF